MRSLGVLLVLAACVADESDDGTEPLRAHKVVMMEIPVSPPRANLSVASPCFSVPLKVVDGLYDCSVTEALLDAPHRILSMCDATQRDACYRIGHDALNCLEANHEVLEIERASPITTDYVMLVQCVSQ